MAIKTRTSEPRSAAVRSSAKPAASSTALKLQAPPVPDRFVAITGHTSAAPRDAAKDQQLLAELQRARGQALHGDDESGR